MKVLSLFDGISGARLALQRCKIKHDYICSEIDKFAIDVSRYHCDNSIRIGDVKEVNFNKIGDVDLLIGGPPCQDLSLSKKDRKGLVGKNSSLFFKYIEALNICNPKYFIMENVASMRDSDRDTISSYLGVSPISINSSLFTAQLRNRYYWCNFLVEEPKNLGIKLQDILETGNTDREKSYCIDACYYKGASPSFYHRSNRRQMVIECGKYRILTPIECERLQTYPDNYTQLGLNKSISKTQRYKMLGNSFTVSVIEHILRGIK